MIFHVDNYGAREGIDIPERRNVITVGDLAARLWRARLWAVGGAVALAVVCLLVMPFIKPVYEASAQIYIDPQSLQLLQNDLTPALSGGDSGVLVAESQVRIMQSESVLRRVVEKLDLMNDEEFAGKTGSSLSFGGAGQQGPDPVQQAVERLSKNVNVVREDRTYMITVYARSHSAVRAAEIGNAMVDAYLQVRDSHRTELARSATDSLEGRLVALQSAVKEREDAVAKFKVDNNIIDANGNLIAENRLSQNSTVISTMQESMNRREVERDQLRELLPYPERFLSSPVASVSPDLLRLRGQLERAQSDLSLLKATLGPRHPRVITAESAVTSVRSAINAEMNRLGRNAEIDYERAKADYAMALKSQEPLVSAVQDIDAARIQWRQLQRDADSARAVYEEALTRSRETREQGSLNTLNAQVVSRASTPIRRRSPPPMSLMLVVFVGLGMSLGLASGVVYDVVRRQPGRNENNSVIPLLDMARWETDEMRKSA